VGLLTLDECVNVLDRVYPASLNDLIYSHSVVHAWSSGEKFIDFCAHHGVVRNAMDTDTIYFWCGPPKNHEIRAGKAGQFIADRLLWAAVRDGLSPVRRALRIELLSSCP
jgi:hypothetical protein